MTGPTKLDLTQETIEHIQDLIQANLDSAAGYEEAGSVVGDDYFRNVFIGIGQQRRRHARELQYYVVLNGQRAASEESWLARFQRGWLDLRAALNGGDQHYLLGAMEQTELEIEESYQQALNEICGSSMCDVLSSQLSVVRDEKMRLKQLKSRISR